MADDELGETGPKVYLYYGVYINGAVLYSQLLCEACQGLVQILRLYV